MSDVVKYIDMRIAECAELGHDHMALTLKAVQALRAELTEARRQLKEASEQEPVAMVVHHNPPFGAVYKVEWYTKYRDLPDGTKLYAAPVPQTAVPEAVAKDARLGNRLHVWDYENPEDGSWDNIEEYLHDTTPNVGEVVRLNLAMPLTDVVVEMLEVGDCGEPIRWEVRDVKTGTILSATDTEGRKDE